MQYTSYSVVKAHVKDFTYNKYEAAYLTKKKGKLFLFSMDKACIWAVSTEYLMHSKSITYSEEIYAHTYVTEIKILIKHRQT